MSLLNRINIFVRNNVRIIHLAKILHYKVFVKYSKQRYSLPENYKSFCTKTAAFVETEADLATSQYPYYVENGLRKVYPYYYKHSAYCKGRWIKQNLIDMYHKEFALYPREEYVNRVLKGILCVNGKTVGLNYILKHSDYVTCVVHRHELAVLAAKIDILYEDDDLLVIDKPPSIPVHTCALYRYNTISCILSLDYNYGKLYEIHRLDRLTSGVLIFAKNSKKASEMHKQIRLRDIKKEYVCRVEGNFPDVSVICDKPIKQIYNKVGVNIVHPEGKTCVTEFQKLSYNGKSSVVLCKPHTGRTHQIRVHLQFLGFPIVSDPLYNSYVFGPEKGKNGITKPIEQLKADLTDEHSSQWWLEVSPKLAAKNNLLESDLKDILTRTYYINSNNIFSNERYKKDYSRIMHDEGCYFCKQKFRDPNQTNLLMLLHALRYQTEDWEYKTKMPLWTSEDWSEI